MKDIEFVIAKYREDTSWVDILHPYQYRIYSKDEGGDLPNVGREAHTYLHHIIENYDKLAEVTVLLQGNPFDHLTDVSNRPKSRDEIKLFVDTHTFEKTEPFFTEFIHPMDAVAGAYRRLFEGEIRSPGFTPGALWIVQRPDILARPRMFYELLQKEVIEREGNYHEEHTFNPWSLERLWQFIFDPSMPIISSFYSL